MKDIPFQNPVKQLLRQGKKAAGAWVQTGSPVTAEIMAGAGFDVILLDLEHAPGDSMTLVHICQALGGTGAVPMVRAAWNDFIQIKRILDAGAHGVLIPYVNTGKEAEAAVRACKYPPEGIRGVAGSPRAAGYGRNKGDYLNRANDELLILTAVETGEAVENLEEILAVPGLDGIFIGPMDLASSLGHFGDPGHAGVRSVVGTIEKKVLAAGKVLASLCSSWKDANAMYERGYRLLMLMADGVALSHMAAEKVARFRDAYPDR
jgi:2-dehydro-3-deoxyglucarate aldolase/4-hydroxy-2-oxoheptanedioate aldolase